MEFLAKILLSLVFTLILFIFLFILVLLYSFFQNIGTMYTSIIVPMTIALSPSIFTAVMANNIAIKLRFFAVLKALVLIIPIHSLWIFAIGPWIGSILFAHFSAPISYAFALDAVASILIMISSAVLTSWCLPKLDLSDPGPAPRSVLLFRYLMFASIFVSIINTIISYSFAEQLFNKEFSTYNSLPQASGPFIISIWLSSLLICIYFIRQISFYANARIRTVMLSFYIVGLITMIPSISVWIQLNLYASILSIAITVIQGIALIAIYSESSDFWFGRGSLQLVGGDVHPNS